MTKISIGLIFLALLMTGCPQRAKVGKELVYSTLNEIIQQDSISARIICSKFDQPSIPSDIQQEFFSGDKEFLQEQVKSPINLSVDTGLLYYYSRRNKAFEKSLIDTTCSKDIHYRFSFPVFSEDLQTVVIGITEDCNCLLGGWGFKAVYKKQNGKWKLIRKFDDWIS